MKQKQQEINEDLLILTQKSKLLVPQFKKHQELCDVCQKFMAKYECPKCKKMQCSLICYKNHDESCVENFVKNQKIAEMKGIKASFEEQKQMRKILNKAYEESKDECILQFNEEQQIKRLEELADLCEQGKLNIDNLTIAEQSDFAKFIEQMVIEQPWIPWWEIEDGSFSMYVDDAPLKSDYADNPYLEFRKSLKDKIKVIIPFEKISKNVNDDLKNHLFNLVSSIAIVSKTLDGEILELNREFYNMFIMLSFTMDDKTSKIGNIDLAYKKLKEHAHLIDKGLILPYINKLDLVKIFSNKFYVIETLFYAYDAIHTLQHQAENEDNSDFEETKKLLKILNQKKQKLIYYISYGLSKNHNFYQDLCKEIKELIE